MDKFGKSELFENLSGQIDGKTDEISDVQTEFESVEEVVVLAEESLEAETVEMAKEQAEFTNPLTACIFFGSISKALEKATTAFSF